MAKALLYGALDLAVCEFRITARPPHQGLFEEGDPTAQITKEVDIESEFIVVSNVTKTTTPSADRTLL